MLSSDALTENSLSDSGHATVDAVFQARSLTKTYAMGDVEVHALRGVDVDLYRGEFVVLLGPSGSGKSTLLNILGGLDIPTAGRVRYLDHDLTNADEAALTHYRRDHVGFIFQFYNLTPSLTAHENVALVTEIAKQPLPPEAALDLVGMADRVNHFRAQLSGGEQQRVAVAAFLTNMVVARLIAIERNEIGLLKAIGYSRAQVGWHYAKLVIAMTAVGIVLGWIVGVWLGRFNTELYAESFNFPLLIFRPGMAVFGSGAAVSLVAALGGALGAVRQATALPPAEAMRPPALRRHWQTNWS